MKEGGVERGGKSYLSLSPEAVGSIDELILWDLVGGRQRLNASQFGVLTSLVQPTARPDLLLAAVDSETTKGTFQSIPAALPEIADAVSVLSGVFPGVRFPMTPRFRHLAFSERFHGLDAVVNYDEAVKDAHVFDSSPAALVASIPRELFVGSDWITVGLIDFINKQYTVPTALPFAFILDLPEIRPEIMAAVQERMSLCGNLKIKPMDLDAALQLACQQYVALAEVNRSHIFASTAAGPNGGTLDVCVHPRGGIYIRERNCPSGAAANPWTQIPTSSFYLERSLEE